MWYQVTRNPQEFHRLMGCQRDPRDRGVTLKLVNSDVCEPMEVDMLGGNKYFVTFIADTS